MFYKVDDVFWQDYLSIIGLVIIIIICFLETDQRERSFQLNGVYFRKKYLGLAVFFVALGFAFAHPIYSHIYTPIVQSERGLIGKNGTIYFRHAKVTKMFHTAKSRSCNGVRIELLDGVSVSILHILDLVDAPETETSGALRIFNNFHSKNVRCIVLILTIGVNGQLHAKGNAFQPDLYSVVMVNNHFI